MTETYKDVLFDLPDGSQLLLTIYKNDTYRICSRPDTDHGTPWGPPTWGGLEAK